MNRLWLITNPASGSAGGEKCAALEAVCGDRGLSLVGRTEFPEQRLPDVLALQAAGVDTVLLFAGDGTINAAIDKLRDWSGAVLILPGGTMNMLAKQLHGEADAAAIVHAAHEQPRLTYLPYVAVGERRAYVGMLAGPVTAWADARESLREGDLTALPAKAAAAWSGSWSQDVAAHDGDTLIGRFNAVFVEPRDGGMAVSGVAAEGIADVARLGWAWAAGDWRASPTVEDWVMASVVLSAHNDGEGAALDSPVTVRSGLSDIRFLTTLPN